MYLFVYGVLIRELASGCAAELIAPLGEGVPATVRGAVYGLQGKDGGLLSGPDGGEVCGMVHEASGVDWHGMDLFENALDGPYPEYRRPPLPGALPDGSILPALAYCYARKVPGHAEPIGCGSFAQRLAETRRQPIGLR